MSNKILSAAIIAGALTMASTATAGEHKHKKMEKCYGVVKAGHNDCGSKDGSHSCSGNAKVDGSPNEWLYLPAGICDKLANGMVEDRPDSETDPHGELK